MIITTVLTGSSAPAVNSTRWYIKIIIKVMFISSSLIISGCSTIPGYRVSLPENVTANWDVCQKLSKHFIAFGKRGEFVPIYFKECSNISVSSATSVVDIVNEIKYQKKDNKIKKLMIFIHGGLDSPDGDILDNNEGTIKRFSKDIQDITCENPGAYTKQCEQMGYYPLFIIWPSAFFDTYKDSILNNYQGEWDGKIPTISSPFRLSLDVAEIIIRAPQNFFHQFKLGVDSEFLTDSTCFNSSGYYCVGNGLGDTYNFRLNQALENWGKIGYPIKLLTTPIADPLGRRAWQSMVSRSHFGFQTPCGMKMGFMPSYDPCQHGALMSFFEELIKSDLKNIPITLIGHSMGTILASEIIRDNPTLNYNEIVFMGAAASIRKYKNDVEPVLKKRYEDHQDWQKSNKKSDQEKESISKIQSAISSLNLKQQPSKKIENLKDQTLNAQLIIENNREAEPKLIKFYNLSLHPFAEASEINYAASLPAGSLLEWIDYNFTSPSDLAYRKLGKWVNLVSMENYFNKNLFKEVVFFKRFDLSCKSPVKHGEFITPSERSKKCTEIRYWQPEFWTP